jgi:hypothetical protein
MNKTKYLRRWRKENKEAIRLYHQDYYNRNKESFVTLREKNKEARKVYDQQYALKNKRKKAKQHKQWRLRNREKLRLYRSRYMQVRRSEDPAFKLLTNLRSRLHNALKTTIKSKTTKELLGCTTEELKVHLTNLFLPDMTWANYGKWHVDHVIPCASFDLIKEEEQKKCFHFSNLQPLWKTANLRKGAKL